MNRRLLLLVVPVWLAQGVNTLQIVLSVLCLYSGYYCELYVQTMCHVCKRGVATYLAVYSYDGSIHRTIDVASSKALYMTAADHGSNTRAQTCQNVCCCNILHYLVSISNTELRYTRSEVVLRAD
jgi:hypothetical protein